MNQPFKTFVKNQLVQSAKSYSKLIVKRITIASESFEHAKSYSIRFYKTNFLHLTGVSTTLKPKLFMKNVLML